MHSDFHPIPAERPQWGDAAAVVVPVEASRQRVAAIIDPGSGIVACGLRGNPGKVLVYFEGNRFDAENLRTLRDRALNAYGRMAKSYPTVAMALLDRSDFEVVGTIDPSHFELDTTSANVQAWVAQDPRLIAAPQRRRGFGPGR